MKPYSRLFLFIICVLPFDAIAFSQTPNDSLSLDQAIAKVVSGNPSVRELSSSVGATTARVSQSEDPRYPTAEVVGSYTRLGPASQFDLPGLGSLKLYPLDNYDAHVAVHETVYDFDRTSQSINLAQSQVTIASDRVDLMKRDLAFQTARSFYAILFLRKSIDVQNSQIDALNQHLETVKKKVASGTATD
ncbi:MAG TPA: TolC family protein, partial [Bacteroidota bacterium]|nr:TolC family protein [Bacteroidota bacterium]